MPKKIVISLFLLVLFSGVVLTFYLNPETVKIHPWFDITLEFPLALVLIAYFCVGAFLVSLIVLGILARNYLESLKQKNEIKKLGAQGSSLAKARELIAARSLPRAISMLNSIINKQPDNILARLHLAEAHKESGELREARKVLEDCRASHSQNIELLFALADINLRLGSETSAYDNISLVLKQEPENVRALSELRDRCVSLGRFNDAVSYQQTIVKQVTGEAQEEAQDILCELEVKSIENDKAISEDERRTLLRSIVRRHKANAYALLHLGNSENAMGDQKLATRYYEKSFMASGKKEPLEKIASICLAKGKEEEALGLVKSCIADYKSNHEKCDEGDIYLINLLASMGRLDDAEKQVAVIRNRPLISDKLNSQLSYLEGIVLKKRGNTSGAMHQFQSAVEAISQ